MRWSRTATRLSARAATTSTPSRSSCRACCRRSRPCSAPSRSDPAGMHGPPQPPRDDDGARFGRALRAHLRQEFIAPSAAILGYAEMLIEDARRSSLAEAVADLDRIHMAGVNLNAVLQSALDDRPDGALSDPTKLRHDLRTPINAIKGYGEMLLEDAVDGGQD